MSIRREVNSHARKRVTLAHSYDLILLVRFSLTKGFLCELGR
jgi:hypothetical protein